MMSLSHEDVRVMARAVGLALPDTDIADVAARANALLQAVADVETAFKHRLDAYEPIPPVLPARPFDAV
jgi:hypothetical protein